MTAKKKGGKHPDFFEIDDAIMIAKVLEVATRHHISITLWLKNQSIKFDTEFSAAFHENKKLIVEYASEVSNEAFEDAINVQGTNEILGSFQVDQTNYFFKTTCHIKNDSRLLRLSVPTSIYKLQRRENLRIPFMRQVAPKLSMFDPAKNLASVKTISETDILTYRMLDISAGGCGFAAKIDEKQRFALDTEVHDIRFTIRGMEIITNGTVKHVVETSNDVGKLILKIGLEFHDLKMQFDKQIVKFVLDESRKLFTLLY